MRVRCGVALRFVLRCVAFWSVCLRVVFRQRDATGPCAVGVVGVGVGVVGVGVLALVLV